MFSDINSILSEKEKYDITHILNSIKTPQQKAVTGLNQRRNGHRQPAGPIQSRIPYRLVETNFLRPGQSRNFFCFFLNFWLIKKSSVEMLCFACQTSSVHVYDKVYKEKYTIPFILSQG